MRVTYRLEKRGSHCHLSIWVNGALSGNLCVRDDSVNSVGLGGERDLLVGIVDHLRDIGAKGEVEL